MAQLQDKRSRNGGGGSRPGLGWLSIGLGLAQVAAPRAVGRAIGLRKAPSTNAAVVALGVVEIATGVGMLLRTGRANGTSRLRSKTEHTLHCMRSTTVNRSLEEVYAFWRQLENFPRFMAHLESVTVDGTTSHWRAKAPVGMSIEWDAVITEDVPNECIAWRSLEGAQVPNYGSVRFTRSPGGRGTEVHVDLRYEIPGGKLASLVAKLFGEEPAVQIDGDIRRFKQVMETGEVVHSDASIHRGPHPACPSSKNEKETIL